MKQILLELDDRCARDLDKVAPVGKRVRAEFIRLALRRAIDLALDRDTEAAYRAQPLSSELTPRTYSAGTSRTRSRSRPLPPRPRALVEGPSPRAATSRSSARSVMCCIAQS